MCCVEALSDEAAAGVMMVLAALMMVVVLCVAVLRSLNWAEWMNGWMEWVGNVRFERLAVENKLCTGAITSALASIVLCVRMFYMYIP